ncbi:MAG: TIGR01212 family radical SAM protein [Paraclostridium bifermentans]|uniref:Radical SAM superfamily protein n=1 Tax=Paraclostridium bifermentans ATCC 638 = DSM 14991 TaxID=1233171 RepID=T4VNR9_PARBF|nr:MULTISPECIES: TIGR01212 family radical SAM protein [Paraclostridium]RDC49912.1 TIGR01212 family radical SAM protein [Acinetobacter sp. RIT592]EQK42421.1 radical SAM superfamily protein [[Clostridium] bifermentans ATCC 638] [Paraclostridium bifermentans ATCC 638 = DSM 14991]MBS5952435.1 TIGR01212 family radical SAM protein [Paraclostridium bifermentans]MBS6507331.1 TIGR01212 family radical SAM protein [Paraclostridium bifermentans]MBU5287829.1 TIGR01212 family radical SAM protein [Paraclostr
MTNFKYAFDNKRYHTWNYYLRSNFGEKVFKVSINAGFSCPNIDGTVAYGGCTYCSKQGSGDFAGNPNDNLIKQFEDIKEMMHKKWHNAKYIGYFQAFTNTHAPVSVLKEKYETILNLDDVIGLSISTRPDCLPDDVLEYLSELNKKTNLWVELGLQTIHDETSKIINRGHDYNTFLEGVEKLKKHNIKTVVHIINGLPGEDYNMMMETAKAVADLGVHGIKIHLLHVLKETPMENMLKKGMFNLMEKDDYINLVCDQLEIIPPEMVVHRLTGDGKRDEIVGPMWSLKKWEVLNAIDDTMRERNSYQGIKYCNKK